MEERIKTLVDRCCRLNYWFCNEMMKEEEEAKEFEKECEKAKESGENIIIITASYGNAKCMRGCMEETVKVINYLRNKKNREYIEAWQVSGAEAMFNQCKEDGVIPFDLPGALMAVLGMWEELEKELTK